MHVDQLPVVEPNNNGNQVQPPEEIVVANDNHQTPTEEEAVTSPGQGKRKSPVWDHFERVKINDIWKAKCNYCRKLLGGDSSNGTSHLRSHVKSCIQKRIHDGSQKVLSPNLLIKGKTELVATAYNPEVSKKELATAVLMHEYPLSIVEHLHFKRFCYSLQPLFNVPSRNTLKRDVMRLYFDERAKIQRLIDSSKGRVAITTDMWTASNERKGYMAVTAHYIDNGWCLRSQLLRFMYVPAPHTADRLARFLVDCLMEWNVDTKVSTITLDNCSTNDRMLENVKTKLALPLLIKDEALIHMRCSAHILNLVVKDGLDVVRDGIEKIRESVCYWMATPKRLEFFQETAKQLKLRHDKRLVLDCPTRWNSTYAMLSCAMPYRDVFSRLKLRDAQYNCLPSTAHWQFAAIVCEKLEVFSLISDMFSGSKYPTINLFFPRICDLRVKITEWLWDPNVVISNMAQTMWSKFSKYWEVIHQILAVAVVLDPRYMLEIVEYYAEKIGPAECGFSAASVKQILCDLILEYQSRHTKNQSSVGVGTSDLENGTSTSNDLDFELFLTQRKKARTTAVVTELDNYLNEDVLPRSSDFDILMWWKLSGLKYPILQAVARDVLVIPVTSVASESAFSSGGRLLDPHRSKLHSATVEALMCTRSWLKDEYERGTPI
ncbi:Putative AC transposase [Linum perenne]